MSPELIKRRSMAPMIRTASWEFMRWSGKGLDTASKQWATRSLSDVCWLARAIPAPAAIVRALESPWFVVVPYLAVAGNLLEDHPVAPFPIGMTVMNVAIAAGLDWCVTFGSGRVGFGACSIPAPLVFVGTISYSFNLPWLRLRHWVHSCWHRPSAAPAAGLPGRQLNDEHILTEGTL